MTMKAHGYATHSATSPSIPFQFERRDPRSDDVTIEILDCGVCHSDLHQARDNWSNSIYPMVPGHEIIGRVIAAGPEVTRFKQDDHVGVGCMVDSASNATPAKTVWSNTAAAGRLTLTTPSTGRARRPMAAIPTASS